MNTETLICPTGRRYIVVLDANQAFPNDPGQGTPAMVYGPGKASATYWCAADCGELDCGEQELPARVIAWLHDIEDRVSDYVNKAFDHAGSTGGQHHEHHNRRNV